MTLSHTSRGMAILAIRFQIETWRGQMLALTSAAKGIHPALRGRDEATIDSLTEAIALAEVAISDLQALCDCPTCCAARNATAEAVADVIDGRR